MSCTPSFRSIHRRELEDQLKQQYMRVSRLHAATLVRKIKSADSGGEASLAL
jgi:hypothetical protein